MHLAKKLKLDSETLIAAVESGPCASSHVKRMIRPMAEDRLADQSGLAIGLREKDSRYCLAMARALETGMSVGESAYQWYRAAMEEDVADQDDAAMLQSRAANQGVRSVRSLESTRPPGTTRWALSRKRQVSSPPWDLTLSLWPGVTFDLYSLLHARTGSPALAS